LSLFRTRGLSLVTLLLLLECLFVIYDEEGYVSRVVVPIELLRNKSVTDLNGVQYALSTGDLDRESVKSWAFYITGYVEVSRRSRVHSVVEKSEGISER